MQLNPPGLAGYQQAIEGAAYYMHEQGGCLRVVGPDQASFLQRQTTNDTNLLAHGQAVLTILTSPTARILDVIYLFLENEPEPAQSESGAPIGLITLPGNGKRTFNYLKSRIFFMDKVSINDHSSAYAQIELIGPGAGALMKEVGIEAGKTPGRLASFSMPGGLIRTLSLDKSFGAGWRWLLPISALPDVKDFLQKSGAAELSAAAYQTLMVEAGLPRAGHELTEDYTPLEVGLQTAISSTKGCYTGQEIIARQLTYDKVTQSLCGLRLAAPAANGSTITAEDRRVGSVTSGSLSPRWGEIALAVIKKPFNNPGSEVSVAGNPAEVVQLPFMPAAGTA